MTKGEFLDLDVLGSAELDHNKDVIELNKRNVYFIALLILSGGLVSTEVTSAAPIKIAIDPGHGGRDSGAVHGSLKEAELVYKLSSALKQRLDNDPLFTTSITRKDGQFVSIFERTNLVQTGQADVLVSIHANSSNDKNLHGTEIYIRNLLPPDEDLLFLAHRENQHLGPATSSAVALSQKWSTKNEDVKTILQDLKRQNSHRQAAALAEMVWQNWPRRTQRASRVIRQAPFFVITQVDIPAILIEMGYVTNPSDAQWMSQDGTIQTIAESLHKALRQFSATLTTNPAIR